MKTIVFGGSGFLGSHVADALTAAGHTTTIFDKRRPAYLQSGQRFIEGDINDLAAVTQAVEGHETVYNFAGFADLTAALDRPIETVQQNILGCVHQLEAARRAGVKRFVFASSIYVYSETGGFYRVSKQACESYIEEYRKRFNLGYTVLRFGTLYGPRADERNSVYRYLRQALLDRKVTAYGTGDEIREYIYVQDAARMAIDILASGYENQSVIISGNHPMRFRDLLHMIREILGGKVELEFKPASDSTGHYNLTPYTFQPKIGKKLVNTYYMDMGQGLLNVLEELYESTNTTQKEIKE